MKIKRILSERLRKLASSFPAVILTGPRQSGKSTLCRMVFPQKQYVSLEAPDIRAFALEDPRGFLSQFSRGAVIDEVQRAPELLSFLQGIIDDDPAPGRWILTGSQNFLLLESVGQSLAGRVAVLHLLPLTLQEIRRFKTHPHQIDDLMFMGGYPRILDQKLSPTDWISSYISTYLERDVRSVLKVGDLTSFQKFLALCAGRTSQLLNLSSLASDCGISQPTAKAWLSVLESSFIVFCLPGFSQNFNKRLVKMPKLHFYDLGLVCWLLGIRNSKQLQIHPLRGAIFESWVISEIVKSRIHRGKHGGVFYYRDQHGLEVDLIIENENFFNVIEVKAGQTPSVSFADSVNRVGQILETKYVIQKHVIYGGDSKQKLREVHFVPWEIMDARIW